MGRANPQQIDKAALRYMQLRAEDLGPTGLAEAIDGCTAHLTSIFPLAEREARQLALAAWATLTGRATGCYVDLAASSPHLVFVVDPVAGKRHAIPVVDLVRMLGPRRVSGV